MQHCPFCGSVAYGGGCPRCRSTGLSGNFLSNLFGNKKGKKTAKQAQKKVEQAITQGAATQAEATKTAAELGLQAQQVHEAGELAKTRTQTVLKWSVLSVAALAAGAAAIAIIIRRRRKRRQ